MDWRTATNETALAAWDAGEPVWSCDMGGMGPGYEQCIQIMGFDDGEPMNDERTSRCFMDGIDWQHHLDDDPDGTLLFNSVENLRRIKTCLTGGCGIVEVEVKLIRWVEPQNLSD